MTDKIDLNTAFDPIKYEENLSDCIYGEDYPCVFAIRVEKVKEKIQNAQKKLKDGIDNLMGIHEMRGMKYIIDLIDKTFREEFGDKLI